MPGPKRRKPFRGRAKNSRPPGRRTPPPEATGLEARYLKQAQTSSVPLVLKLNDGESVRGAIEYFDRELIKLARPEGPGLLIRKSDIRYLYEE